MYVYSLSKLPMMIFRLVNIIFLKGNGDGRFNFFQSSCIILPLQCIQWLGLGAQLLQAKNIEYGQIVLLHGCSNPTL